MDYNDIIVNQLKLDRYERIQEAKTNGYYKNSNKLIQVIDANTQIVLQEFKTKRATAEWIGIVEWDIKRAIDKVQLIKGLYYMMEIWLSDEEMDNLLYDEKKSAFCL